MKYVKAEVEAIMLSNEDVITISGGTGETEPTPSCKVGDQSYKCATFLFKMNENSVHSTF